MNTGTAKIISYLFHPLIMAFYASAAIFLVNPHYKYVLNDQVKAVILITVLITTFFLPLLSSFFFLKKGYITSLQMDSADERQLPFVTTAIYYVTGFILLYRLPIPNIFGAIVLGAGIAIIIALIINFYWKISIHMIGVGGIAGGLFALSSHSYTNLLLPMAGIFILAGWLGSARLIYGTHTQSQVYAGFVVGFVVEFLVIYFYNII
ncbi:MAG: hypothetical protein HKO56_01960 [Bacteroidia bacterium]|nr:hypothetical protein [Bacteroidia bacterium]NNC85595.1 hypothetical protein [Bacteroidia bacterium]NNM15394.1 hypothetical protein [Bacteroidia bacterium]